MHGIRAHARFAAGLAFSTVAPLELPLWEMWPDQRSVILVRSCASIRLGTRGLQHNETCVL
jgi:hypothetical protein